MSTTSRRLILCFDGTDNTPRDRTNVRRLFELISASSDGVQQAKVYFEGVGTERWTDITGSIFGVGAATRICQGYDWLAAHYQDGDDVFVFGFSRGAFIARSLIQMVSSCGLAVREKLGEWPSGRALEYYKQLAEDGTASLPIYKLSHWAKGRDEQPTELSPESTLLCGLVESGTVRQITFQMAGLWDTVGALGKHFAHDRAPWSGRSGYHNVRVPKSLQHGYHALALDEHRPMFNVTLWRHFVPDGNRADQELAKRFEQRWFCGAHSDVGGGYGDDRLPDLSLEWMLRKAADCGLAFSGGVLPQAGAWLAPVHDSFEAFAGGALDVWGKVIPGDQRLYRRVGRLSLSVTTATGIKGSLEAINEQIDESVDKRFCEDSRYRPPNLVEYYERGRDCDRVSRHQQTERIYANRYWNFTGVYLRPGVKYRLSEIRNLGEPLRDSRHEAASIAGEEWDSVAHKTAAALHGKRFEEARWFELIGTVEKNHPFVIRDGQWFTVPISGQLVCYFNDVQIEWFYSNNSGWRVLNVERAAGSGSDA